jgi:hypothetical protein
MRDYPSITFSEPPEAEWDMRLPRATVMVPPIFPSFQNSTLKTRSFIPLFATSRQALRHSMSPNGCRPGSTSSERRRPLVPGLNPTAPSLSPTSDIIRKGYASLKQQILAPSPDEQLSRPLNSTSWPPHVRQLCLRRP